MDCQRNDHLRRQSYLGKFSKFLVFSFTLTEMAFGRIHYRVDKKDTLSHIIYSKFGSPMYGSKGRLRVVLALNPHILDPNHIKPGDVIYLPDSYVETPHHKVLGPTASEEIGKVLFRAGTGGIEIQQTDKVRKLTSRVISSSANFFTLGMDQAWSDDSQFNLSWDLTNVKFAQPEGIGLSKTDFLLSKFSGTYSHKISDKLKSGLKTEFSQLPQLQRDNATTSKIETPWIPVVSPAVIFNHKISRHYEFKPYISMSLKKMQVWTKAFWFERNFSDADSDIKVQELKFLVGIKIPILGD
jgi:hypothetical protein